MGKIVRESFELLRLIVHTGEESIERLRKAVEIIGRISFYPDELRCERLARHEGSGTPVNVTNWLVENICKRECHEEDRRKREKRKAIHIVEESFTLVHEVRHIHSEHENIPLGIDIFHEKV